jgi:hypothetical protein
MITRCSSLLTAGVCLLLQTATASAETVLANGLRNTGLGFVNLAVIPPQWVLPYGYWSPSDHAILETSGLTSLGLEGVEVHLGHAQGGAYFYAWAEAQPGYIMSGLSFGSVDGLTGQYLGAIAGRRENEWGTFTAWVDFSPLSLGPYRYRFYSYGGFYREVVSWERQLNFNQAYYAPRVNPCALGTNGQLIAVIDFQNSYAEVHLEDESMSMLVTRLEISPAHRHRPIDFATSVQVRGGGGLNLFVLSQVEPFAFGFPHHIVGGGTARLEVEPRRAHLSREPDSGNMFLGAWTETPASVSTKLQLEPLLAETNDVQLKLEGIGYGTFGEGNYVGQALLTLRTNSASLWGRLDICTNQQAVVLRQGVEVGFTPFTTNPATLEIEAPVGLREVSVLAHTTNTLAALRFVLDRVAPVTLPDGRQFDGDEVRVRAGAAATLEFVRRAGLTASNLASVTILNELIVPSQTPALTIEPVGQALHISWPDPNRVYHLQSSTADMNNEWHDVPDQPLLTNAIATVIVPKHANENVFFRLIIGMGWDRAPGRD